MAKARTCRSPRRNTPPSGEDKLTKGPPGALNKSSNIPTSSPPVSRAQTPAQPPVLSSSKELYHQLLKTDVATVQLLEQNHGSGPCE